jgi:hypothetical protein
MRSILRITLVGAVLAGLLAVGLGSAAAVQPAQRFSDVPPSHPFYNDIEWAASEGIVRGFPNGQFKPGNLVTRASMAVFMYRDAGQPTFEPPATPSFNDVPTTHPFYLEIEWVVDEMITTGFPDGSYRPTEEVRRQSAAAFYYRAAGLPVFDDPDVPSFTDVPTTHPFFYEIEWAVREGVFNGFPDGTFRPSATATRQAGAATLHRYDGI